jgi:hypothetical protein
MTGERGGEELVVARAAEGGSGVSGDLGAGVDLLGASEKSCLLTQLPQSGHT